MVFFTRFESRGQSLGGHILSFRICQQLIGEMFNVFIDTEAEAVPGWIMIGPNESI